MKKQICYNLSRLATDFITALDLLIDSFVFSRLKNSRIRRRNRPPQAERTIKSPLLKKNMYENKQTIPDSQTTAKENSFST